MVFAGRDLSLVPKRSKRLDVMQSKARTMSSALDRQLATLVLAHCSSDAGIRWRKVDVRDTHVEVPGLFGDAFRSGCGSYSVSGSQILMSSAPLDGTEAVSNGMVV